MFVAFDKRESWSRLETREAVQGKDSISTRLTGNGKAGAAARILIWVPALA
jgi:hypothetical protein